MCRAWKGESDSWWRWYTFLFTFKDVCSTYSSFYVYFQQELSWLITTITCIIIHGIKEKEYNKKSSRSLHLAFASEMDGWKSEVLTLEEWLLFRWISSDTAHFTQNKVWQSGTWQFQFNPEQKSKFCKNIINV